MSRRPRDMYGRLPEVSCFALAFSMPPSSTGVDAMVSIVPFSSAPQMFTTQGSKVLARDIASTISPLPSANKAKEVDSSYQRRDADNDGGEASDELQGNVVVRLLNVVCYFVVYVS